MWCHSKRVGPRPLSKGCAVKLRNSLGLLFATGLFAVISCSSDQKSSTSNGGSAGITGTGGAAGGVATGGTNSTGTGGTGVAGAGTAGAGGVVITPPSCSPMPTNGDACNQQGGACTSAPTLCVCYTGTWICADSSTCGATQPANRDACVGSEGLACEYNGDTACVCVAPNAQQDAVWRCIPIVVGGAGGAAGGGGAGGAIAAGGTAGQGTAGTAGRGQGPGGRGAGGRGP